MKIKLKIRQKILLYILTASALLYVVAIGYIVIDSRKNLLNESVNNAKQSAQLAAADVKLFFEKDLSLVRTLSKAFSVYRTMTPEKWQKLWVDMYIPLMKSNPQIYAIWDGWELKDFVPGYDKTYGRLAHTIARVGNEVSWTRENRSMTGDQASYANLKKNAVEKLWEPYQDELLINGQQQLMTTLSAPVLIDGKFVGVIGADVVLSTIQENIAKIKPSEGSFAFLVSNSSIVAAHTNKDLIFKGLADIYKNDFKIQNLGERIQKGEEFSYYHTDSLGNQSYLSYSPVCVSNLSTPWSLVISTPVKVLTQKADRSLYISTFVGVVGLLLIILVLIFVSNNLTKPISRITSILKRLANGEISNDLKIEMNTGNEIEEMAKALNISVEGLNKKATSATNIGKGLYDTEISLLSDKDMLGKSLIEMRDSLKNAALEDEKRKVEEEKRTWANEGLAKFAEILRQNNADFQLLCDSIIKNLVRYIGANQGGIFLWNEEDKEDKHFDLVAAFAWDRKKYISKRLEKGEGLVGACALEKDTILITQVPSDYVAITSGLGSANPRCVILVPLKQENVVLGVIEVASFKILEKYQIEFFEKVAESIASTILTVRINERTKALLTQSQQQSEEMAAQEEEMRQNMEELQATQEEAARKAGEIEGLINSLNTSSYLVEYDMKGTIINANDAFMSRLGITRQQLVGTHHSGNIEMSEIQKREYGRFWDDLRAGKSKKVKSNLSWQGKTISLIETYFPVANGDGHFYKVMKLAHELEEFN